MATIIEGAWFTITEAVGDHMVETGLLKKCESNHHGVSAFDKPVYHISCDAPRWFGFATIAGAIAGAEKALEEATNAEETKQSG